MRIKASILLSRFALAAVGAHSSDISDSQSQAVTTTQLAAWITGGVSGGRLVNERGLATLPTRKERKQLELVGEGAELTKAVSSGHAFSAKIGPAIPAGLVKAASDGPSSDFMRRRQSCEG